MLDRKFDRWILEGSSPAVSSATVVLVCLWLTPLATFLPIALFALLIAAGIALGRGCGLLAVVAGASMILGSTSRSEERLAIDWELPILVEGTVRSHPLYADEYVRFELQSQLVRQGTQIGMVSRRMLVTIGVSDRSRVEGQLRLGEGIRARGYLSADTSYRNGKYSNQRIGHVSLRIKNDYLLRVVSPPPAIARLCSAWRALVAIALQRHPRLAVKGLGLVKALVLGDPTELDEVWTRELRRFGLSHLIAVSGLHFAIVSSLSFFILLKVDLRARLVVTLGVSCAYLALVGPRDSALRAALMMIFALLSVLKTRAPLPWNCLAGTVLVILAADPLALSRLGFRLSVAATGGILIVVSAQGIPPWCRLLLVSMGAQLAAAPHLVPLTGALHPIAPFFNLVALPWLAVVLFTAFMWTGLVLSGIDPGPLALAMEVLVAPLDHLASIPASRLIMTAIPFWAPSTIALVLLAAAVAHKSWRLVVLAVLAGLCTAPHRNPPEALEIVAIDVGQGDAIVIRDGPKAALIDGGGWRQGSFAARVLFPALASLNISRLDIAILTHPDADHCNGLEELSSYMPIGELWMSSGWSSDRCADSLRSSIGRWDRVPHGRMRSLGRWTLQILHPPDETPFQGRTPSRNDRSLVILASTARTRLLLTGDLEAEGERRLLRQWKTALEADILKVAHHGSRGSTTAGFLDAVSPRLALISSGKSNTYGHPHAETLLRLQRSGAQILRTDLLGMIRIRLPSQPDTPMRLGLGGLLPE